MEADWKVRASPAQIDRDRQLSVVDACRSSLPGFIGAISVAWKLVQISRRLAVLLRDVWRMLRAVINVSSQQTSIKRLCAGKPPARRSGHTPSRNRGDRNGQPHIFHPFPLVRDSCWATAGRARDTQRVKQAVPSDPVSKKFYDPSAKPDPKIRISNAHTRNLVPVRPQAHATSTREMWRRARKTAAFAECLQRPLRCKGFLKTQKRENPSLRMGFSLPP